METRWRGSDDRRRKMLNEKQAEQQSRVMRVGVRYRRTAKGFYSKFGRGGARIKSKGENDCGGGASPHNLVLAFLCMAQLSGIRPLRAEI